MEQQVWDNFAQVVEGRHSIRAFQPKPVAQHELEAIFQLAQWAPSNCNTQPWQVAVASGAAIEALRRELPTSMMKGEMQMDFPYDGKYPGVYRERQIAAAEALYGAQEIAREDKAKRGEVFFHNFAFFGAPHVAFIFLPEHFGLREAADCGMYAQTLMLALQARGIASCPQTALSFHCDQVRERLGVPANLKLLFGISFGYAVDEAPANRCRTDRASLAESVRFVSEPQG